MANLSELLDPYFISIGIEPQRLSLSGRKYEGSYKGRLLKADCSRRSRTRYAGSVRVRGYHGHRLNFTLGTPLHTRLILAPAGTLSTVVGFFNRRAGLTELNDLGAAYEYLTIWAYEPEWAYRLLGESGARDMIHYLLPRDNLPGNIALNLQPEQLLFSQRLPLTQISPVRARNWVTAMDNLLIVAERLPAPTRTARPTWLEVQSKKNPTLVGIGFLAAIIALLLLISACFVGGLLAISFLASA